MDRTDQTPTSRPSFLDRQKDAALAEVREQQADRRRISDLVLGASDRRRRVTDVIKLGNDYLVEITDKDDVTWTTVVNGKRSSTYHYRQEEAVLHLIARRYDSNVNSNVHAAFYAGRVLGLPTDQD